MLPEGATLLVAFPGVANLGKVAVDSIGNLHDGLELAPPPIGLPPHAELDEDGLLAPPHYSLRRIDTETGHLLTLTGKAQPNEPGQQSTLADELMTFFQNERLSTVLVLAGMIDKPDVKETFAVASSSSFRIDMESLGVDVRRDAPTFRRHRLGSLARIHGATLRHELRLRDCDHRWQQRRHPGLSATHRALGTLVQLWSHGSEGQRCVASARLEALAPKVKDDLVKK